MNETIKKYGITAAITAVLAVAVPVTSHFEGLRTRAYDDLGGVLTICYGETDGVKKGEVKTPQQCRDMLQNRLGGFALQVQSLVKVPMTVERWAAFTDFAYNVGLGNFAKSSLLKKLNSGDTVGACNELMRWRFVAGVEVPGLTRRRAAERELCLKGLK